MALGRQQPDARPLALEQRIGRDRGAVDDALGLGKQRMQLHPERLGQAFQAVHDAAATGRPEWTAPWPA